jgi:hypothetical protein
VGPKQRIRGRLPASLQGSEAGGPIPLRSFLFTPADIFGHEVDGTQPDATQDNCYKEVSATHARNPFQIEAFPQQQYQAGGRFTQFTKWRSRAPDFGVLHFL